MTKILVQYNQPANAAAFDQYYREQHIPLASTLPGLRSYRISKAPLRVLSGTPAYLIAELTFDSMADVDAALASPQGEATAADLGNFADGGASILIYESEPV